MRQFLATKVATLKHADGEYKAAGYLRSLGKKSTASFWRELNFSLPRMRLTSSKSRIHQGTADKNVFKAGLGKVFD